MLFFARLDIAGLCEYFNNLVPTCIWYRSIVKILTRVDWCHIMIDNMRYISLLAASIYNTCYISRACTPLSINAFICLAYITRVIHLFMHYTLHLYGWRRRACALALVLARISTYAPRAAPARRRHSLGDAVGIACACSIYRVDDYAPRIWMDGGAAAPLTRRVRSLAARHCEYFNKIGPYCWRSNVLIIHNNYCSGDRLLSREMNYNLSNIKAPCDIYFKNQLSYAARDIVKILTRDAPIDGGASSL